MFYWRPVFFGLPVLYILAIFEIGSPFMSRPACTVILFVLSWVAGMTGVHHCDPPLVEMEFQELFFAQAGLEPHPPNLVSQA
jgi:hypothetical protein